LPGEKAKAEQKVKRKNYPVVTDRDIKKRQMKKNRIQIPDGQGVAPERFWRLMQNQGF
jgi:hypothetical protein